MMKITSPVFANNQTIPFEHTCAGENVSPPLEFADIPENAKSLVLIVPDLDAPNHWIHWLVFNIPPTTTSVNKHEIPQGGTEGLANNHTFGYEGPCPNYYKGTHHYGFQLYTLDAQLDLPNASETPQVLQAMEGHIIQKAELIGTQEGTMK